MAKSPPTPAPAPVQLTPVQQCAVRARHLLKTHFHGAGKADSEGLRALRAIIEGLEAPQHGAAALQDLLSLLSDAASVSAFELHTSGVIPCLIAYISAHSLVGSAADVDAQRLARLHEVCSATTAVAYVIETRAHTRIMRT